MHEPGSTGDGARDPLPPAGPRVKRGRHAVPPRLELWRPRRRLVLAGAAMLSLLLVAVLLGSERGDHGRSGAVPRTPFDSTDSRPGVDLPPAPATVEPTESTGPSPSTTPTVPAPPVPAAGARSTRAAPSTPRIRLLAVAGESCPQTTISGYYRRGWFKDWYTRPTGGWTGDGCAGQVVSVPMSGDPTVDDPDNVVVWWFRVPAGVACAIAVFVPGTGNVLDAAGAPATYLVYATTDAGGTPIAEFTIDQVHNQGRWVDGGTFRPLGDQLAVRLVTRGIDWGPGRDGAHLGVSALRARC